MQWENRDQLHKRKLNGTINGVYEDNVHYSIQLRTHNINYRNGRELAFTRGFRPQLQP